jgi:hypothetical protein
MISGVRRDVDEIFALLGCYAAQSGNSVPTFRKNLWDPSSGVKKSLEDGDCSLFRNNGTELSLCAA